MIPTPAFTADPPPGEMTEARVYEPDPLLLWRLKPSSLLDFPELGFRGVRTNSLGLRGPEIPPERKPGEFRVLCLGDSVTFGMGLPEGETWPDQLRAHLGSSPEFSEGPVTVQSGAVPGWSSIQGLWLYDRVADFRPDVVVFWFGLNDSKLAWGAPDRHQRRTDFRWAPRNMRTFQLFQDLLGVEVLPDAEVRRVSVEDFASAVSRFREMERNGGPKVIFVRFPERMETTISEFELMLLRAKREGVAFVAGPVSLLLPAAPADEGTDLTGEVVVPEGERVLVYDPEKAEASLPVEILEEELGKLRDLKRALVERLALLPEDSLGYADLFGDTPPAKVFNDNCHLTALGAALAGRALGREILRRNP